MARTRHLIHLITTADSNITLLKRIEDFIDFIKQYPEAKHVAVKVIIVIMHNVLLVRISSIVSRFIMEYVL